MYSLLRMDAQNLILLAFRVRNLCVAAQPPINPNINLTIKAPTQIIAWAKRFNQPELHLT